MTQIRTAACLTAMLALLNGCGGIGDVEAEEGAEAAVLVGEGEEENGGVMEEALTGGVPIGTVLEATVNTYLRTGPASSYSALGVVPKGGRATTVERTTPSGSYYKIKVGTTIGWGYGPYYKLATAADAGLAPKDAGTAARDAGTATGSTLVDLRADVNRDGVVSTGDLTDEAGEDTFTATRGAVFLANIDDDQVGCAVTYSSGQALSDADLAKCNDAWDEVINGSSDLLDLARLKTVPAPGLPSDAVGRITVSSTRARLFKGAGTSFSIFRSTSTLTAAELRNGVELAIEATDVVRDPAAWDGTVTVTLTVTGTGLNAQDTVKLRVAPVITFHHLTPVEQLYATALPGDFDSQKFQDDLQAGLTLAGITRPLVGLPVNDQWAQDFFEPGYMSMPKAGGAQHVIRVNYRSANVYGSGSYPLREAGRIVFDGLRGRDVAGIQHYDPAFDPSGEADSLDSFGNYETIPPYSYNGVNYPLGRTLRGSTTGFTPDPTFMKMVNAQKQQPTVNIDTSWLLVGHVDESVTFIKANTPRGWVALVNDARLAKTMLENLKAQGFGTTKLFTGMYWQNDFGGETAAAVTINQVLADTEVLAESARSAAEIDTQVVALKAATGLTDGEIIRVPFLHQPVSNLSLAYQPGTVNGVSANDTNFFAPNPHGPVVGGKDVFKTQLEQALGAVGVSVRWVEDWNLYHRLAGEVHCGSNSARAIPSTKWWETGR